MLRSALPLFASLLFAPFMATATEVDVKGLIDVRATSASTSDSYISGGFGKFGYSDGEHLSIAQAGLDGSIAWDNGISAHVVANGWLDGEDDGLGITEGFIRFSALPNEHGYRFSGRGGVVYPAISLENNATAWATPYTLNASMLNTWIGEEIRVAGVEGKLEKLGKFSGANYDFSLTTLVFMNNDPAGALLAWRGWTQGNRQTLWTESRAFPELKQPGLAAQARRSDPFLELDDRPGYHITAEWKLRRKGQVNIGFYDNRAKPYKFEKGHYGWHSQFFHAGAKWRFDSGLQLIAQYLQGNTLMQSPDRVDVVDASYSSGFVMLSKRFDKHRVSVRVEHFEVNDKDDTPLDDNSEDGKGATLSYQYRLSKQWFLASEFNWIDSERGQRQLHDLAVDDTEQQLQLSARYFF